VVQDVFVRVAENRTRLAQVRDPRAWLLSVAHRLAIDHARRKARRETVSLDENPYLEARVDDPARRLDSRAAAAGLDRLSGRQRAAIYLRHYAGCTFAEIGRIAGVPTFTAASRYRLGMKKLQALLGGKR
jgi:RNA polymerase sigma-70 factor (ECF subfamily)